MFIVLPALKFCALGLPAICINQVRKTLSQRKVRKIERELSERFELTSQLKSALVEVNSLIQRGRVSKDEALRIEKALRERVGFAVAAQANFLQQEEEPAEVFEEPAVEGGPRPRVRRGRRWNAAYEVYLGCVAQLGRKPYTPAMRDTVDAVARRVMKEMNVRFADYPTLLPKVATLYFTPTEEDVVFAHTMRSEVHTFLRRMVEQPK